MTFELEQRFDLLFLEAGRDRRRRIGIDQDGGGASGLRTLVTRAAAGDEELVSAGDQIAGTPTASKATSTPNIRRMRIPPPV